MREDTQNSMRYLMVVAVLFLSLLMAFNSYADQASDDKGRKQLMLIVYLANKVGCLSLFKFMVDEKILTKDLESTNTKVQRFCEDSARSSAEEVTK